MNYFYLILFSTFLTPISFAKERCHIESFDRVYTIKNQSNVKKTDVIKNTDCNDKIINDFKELLISSEGAIDNKVISRWFKGESGTPRISPKKIQLLPIKKFFKKQLNIPENRVIADVKSLNHKSALGVDNSDELIVHCSNCISIGNQSIKISANRTQLWFDVTLKMRTKALVAKSNISPHNGPLRPSQFEEKWVSTLSPERIFLNKEKIVFYKPIRHIKQGEPLMFQNMNPVFLVKAGTPVKVVHSSGTLVLSGTARAMRSARWGESIQLKSLKSNRLIIGKVVDFNKVQIEL